MIIPKIPLAQTVVHLCEQKGISRVVISPGSRNAPLTIGFSNNPAFKCYSIVDERVAGFFALGMAQQLRKPVALVCTSGSALLNYYPAVAEAYYSQIPLVVISADRPSYLIGIGDGQTIDQKNAFGSHCHFSANLKEDVEVDEKDDNAPMIIKNMENRLERMLGLQEDVQTRNFNAIELALNRAIERSGPVHINVPFAEPLYETVDQYTIDLNRTLKRPKTASPADYDLDSLIEDWNKSSRKMVLVGTNDPNTVEQKWLNILAEDDSVVVFTETTSNLHHKEFFPGIDKIIAPLDHEDFQKLQPEILLTFGGLIVSKKIKAFLRNYRPKQHWHIDKYHANDTFFSLNVHVRETVNVFFEKFLSRIKSSVSDYRPGWAAVQAFRRRKHEQYLSDMPFCDFKVFDRILNTIPDNCQLQLGNSSAIRYTQLFDLNESLKLFCNRGTSGIDGSTSTAIGASVIEEGQTVFISGDLSFFYDSNALWNQYIPSDFRIILINNQGGGIFRILPGQKDTEMFDRYFETLHDLNASHLCEMYGFEYAKAENESELDRALNGFYEQSEKPKLLEIFTPRQLNDEVLLNYFNFIK